MGRELNKLERRIRREANKLLARRRYRVRQEKGKKKALLTWPVFALRVGPSGPSEKVLDRIKKARERVGLK